jgi:hypothetical protein
MPSHALKSRSPSMPKRQTAARINIPTLLADSVKNKRAILFLGAGASKEAKNAANQTPPDADQLRDILATRFFAQPMKGRDVNGRSRDGDRKQRRHRPGFRCGAPRFRKLPAVRRSQTDKRLQLARDRDHQLRSPRRKGVQRLPAAPADPRSLRQGRPADRGKITGHPLSGSLSQIARLSRPHPRSRHSVNSVARDLHHLFQ